MRRFEIDGKVIGEDCTHLQDILCAAYRDRHRPLCLCKSPGIPTYIARIGAQYLIKRMPFTGAAHDPSCPSHEATGGFDAEDGPGHGAVRLDPASGIAALRLGFSLSRSGPRAAPEAVRQEAGSVAGEDRKLSLIGLLHHLWHEAELTSWTARWTGKRNWPVLRWHLLEAARQMTVRGKPLADRLFIPEPFRATAKAAIEQRRAAALAAIQPQAGKPTRLMLLIGEVKGFADARNGRRLVVKHLPGFELLLEEALHRRLRKRFAVELELWEADQASHVIAIASFSLRPSGLAAVEEIALVLTASNWVPCASLAEKQLVETLARLSTRSVKLPPSEQAAMGPVAVLRRALGSVALHIVPAANSGNFETALQEWIAAHPDIRPWVWRPDKSGMPPLPSP